MPARLDDLLRRLGPVAGAVLMLPVVVVALPFWAVSAVTRWLARQSLLEPALFSDNLIEFVPELGARPRPGLDTHSKAEDVFRLSTDLDGWRGAATLDEADVVVVGDSFAFGYGVDDRDLYCEHVPGARVKPVAAPAYSMVHGVLLMRRLAPRLAGKLVAWFVYCGNDLTDNLYPDIGRYRMPFVSQDPGGAWRIRSDHVSPEPWTFREEARDNDRLFATLCSPTRLSERVFDAADHLIAEASRICTGAGARLAVVSIPITTCIKDPEALRRAAADPQRVDLSLADRRLGASCHRRGIDFLALQPYLRPAHYWQDDMHWNPRGHRVVGEILSRLTTPPG